MDVLSRFDLLREYKIFGGRFVAEVIFVVLLLSVSEVVSIDI